MAACPICKKDSGPRAQNTAFPFCSARCKMVDLGKWLNEEYRAPAEEADDAPAQDPNAARSTDDGET